MSYISYEWQRVPIRCHQCECYPLIEALNCRCLGVHISLFLVPEILGDEAAFKTGSYIHAIQLVYKTRPTYSGICRYVDQLNIIKGTIFQQFCQLRFARWWESFLYVRWEIVNNLRSETPCLYHLIQVAIMRYWYFCRVCNKNIPLLVVWVLNAVCDIQC